MDRRKSVLGKGQSLLGPQFLPWRHRVLASGSAKRERENVPLATTRRQDCGLFVLGLSCRHSSTFFHCSGCPSPTRFPELFQPAMPCLSSSVSLHPVCLHLCVSLSQSLSLRLCLCRTMHLSLLNTGVKHAGV